jgi:hypothetical protein
MIFLALLIISNLPHLIILELVQNKKKRENISPETHRKWKKITAKKLDPDYSFHDGPVDGKFTGETNTSIFLEFIDGFINKLVYKTNLYSVQRGHNLNLKHLKCWTS